MNDHKVQGTGKPPLPFSLGLKLSVMMFLQYAIWGAWLPLFFAFLTEHRGYTGEQAGNLFAIGAIGALLAPFLAGQIADRYFSTEKFLGLSHILGGLLVLQLAYLESYAALLVFALLYSIIYAPTLSLTNSLAFHHLPDRDRDFGKVRVWGTIGWIAVGIAMGQYLYLSPVPAGASEADIRAIHVARMADSFIVSGVLGLILGIYCFFLPKTPPQKGKQAFAAGEAMGEIKTNPLLTLFLVAFPVSCIHQFYFVRTEGFLGSLTQGTAGESAVVKIINNVFGVGGGPMTIGQISEIAVLAMMPWVATRLSRKFLLAIGLGAYVLRFLIFAYMPALAYPALALHGVCFGFFFFVAFIVVDENTSSDVRASAQSLFNLIIIGLGVIVGNYAAGQVDRLALREDGTTDFSILFGIPMWIAIACLVALLVFYPGKRLTRPTEQAAA